MAQAAERAKLTDKSKRSKSRLSGTNQPGLPQDKLLRAEILCGNTRASTQTQSTQAFSKCPSGLSQAR